MRVRFHIFTILLSTVLATAWADVSVVYDSLINVLDNSIDNRKPYIEAKENTLHQLRTLVSEAKDPRSQFESLGHLLDEYASYNTDSSLNICEERLRLSRNIDDRDLHTQAKMDMANILGLTGLYKESLDVLDSIPRNTIPDYLVPFLYHIKRSVYGFMSDYSIRHSEKEKYARLTSAYRDSLISVNPEGSIYHAIILADKLNNEGKPAEGEKILLKWLSDNPDADTHSRAILAYTLSESYGMLGQREKQKEQLAISAIADMESAVREYVSLRKLAIMLYEDGDIERAYRYLKQCMEDAVYCNARLRQVEINDVFPIVNEVYLHTIEKQQNRLRLFLVLISLLTIALLVAYFAVVKQMRKARNARKEVDDANIRLSRMNSELKELIERLREANREIAENSRLKEEYIGGYMDQCSIYIDKLDTFRKKLSNRLASGKTSEVKDMLRSSDMIDEELKAFYAHFDHTFLRLFPSFIDDFNSLLLADKRIEPKTEGRLNTELRIFALIRLGITDSVKIANFLRYSVTTIYNYRTKVRNKAAGNRDALEQKLMEIGTTFDKKSKS